MAEALDIEEPPALLAWLRANGHLGEGEAAEAEVLGGGVSNRTVRVRRAAGPDWVLKQALPRLRVAVEWRSDPRRIRIEAEALRRLPALVPPGAVTPLVFEAPELDLLAMHAVPEPHRNWKQLLLEEAPEAAHVEAFGTLLGTLHRRAAEQAGELAAAFAEREFFEGLRLEPYYLYTAARLPAARAFLADLADRTRARRCTLVHGDYSPKNVLVHAGRLVLLDHEVVHWGDGAFDLGFALTHLLAKANHLPARRDAFGAAAAGFWTAYREALGTPAWAADLEPRAVRHGIACLLARVDGRSPLEYLDAAAQARQRAAALALVPAAPATVAGLVDRFLERL